jgi:hypothetical protein
MWKKNEECQALKMREARLIFGKIPGGRNDGA